MKKKPIRTKDRFGEVVEGFGQLTPSRLESALAKRQKMQIRVSETDKEDIAFTAKWLQLTATEYLLRLHHLTAERLRDRMRKTSRSS